MVHDFATRKKEKPFKKPAAEPKHTLKVAVAAAVIGVVAMGALSFSHVVKAVGSDLNETVNNVALKKAAEEAGKAALKAEKQRLADERRDQKKVSEAKAIAEKGAGYDFYENLVGQPWPVPVAQDAYTNSSNLAVTGPKEDIKNLKYSLQAALFREQSEAQDAVRGLTNLGYPAKIEDVKVKAGGVLYRVTVGPFDGLDKANQVKETLQTKNYYAQLFREE